MDLDSRDWLIVIGALLIVGVLLDAWRRYRNDRRNPIRMGKGTMGPGGGFAKDDADPVSAELPGGGARVIVRDAEPSPVEAAPRAPRRRAPRVEPRVEASAPRARDAVVDEVPDATMPVTADVVPERQPFLHELPEATPAKPTVEPVADVVQAAAVVAPARQTPPQMVAEPMPAVTPAPASGSAPTPRRDVLFVRVVSRGDGGFGGAELARIFKECDVRPGPQQIFQRTENARGEGAVQFTVFNGTAQGVFERELDETFSTRGLGFLMRLGEPQKPLEAFDCMLETARAVARYCDGELRDDTNSVFTQQTGEHCRERIREFAMRSRVRR